ncbi:MAG: C-terminal helicase domain-containing protein [Malacoplasma sp.]|nr:C-terminal helicase domain-containing protein [Malacoplasma sp.]
MSSSLDTLSRLLKTISPYFCIIFANTKTECEEIYQMMIKQNYNVVLIHKDLRQRQRNQIFEKINKNQYQYVIATDLLSRGVDLPNTDLVISYGLPQDTKWYIHRAGRVGRYTRNGTSYLIYKPSDDQLINNLINKNIQWKFLLINKENHLIEKPFKLRIKKKIKFDYSTNAEIKKIINQGSKKVKPGYKKKIQAKINKIKQRKRHEFIEKKIKQQLLISNISRTKKAKKRH